MNILNEAQIEAWQQQLTLEQKAALCTAVGQDEGIRCRHTIGAGHEHPPQPPQRAQLAGCPYQAANFFTHFFIALEARLKPDLKSSTRFRYIATMKENT